MCVSLANDISSVAPLLAPSPSIWSWKKQSKKRFEPRPVCLEDDDWDFGQEVGPLRDARKRMPKTRSLFAVFTSSITQSPTSAILFVSIKLLITEFAFSMVQMYKDLFFRLFRGGIDPLCAAYSSTKKSKSNAKALIPLTCNLFHSDSKGRETGIRNLKHHSCSCGVVHNVTDLFLHNRDKR